MYVLSVLLCVNVVAHGMFLDFIYIFEIISVLTLTVYTDFNPIHCDNLDSIFGIKTNYLLDE